MTDIDESTVFYEAPQEKLVKRICRLARRNEANLPVLWATTHGGVIHVTVGNERAAEAVREIAPGAFITIID